MRGDVMRFWLLHRRFSRSCSSTARTWLVVVRLGRFTDWCLCFNYVVNLSGKPFPIEVWLLVIPGVSPFYFEHNVCQFPIYSATVYQYIANISPIIPMKSGWWLEAHAFILHPTWDDDPQIHRCYRHRMCTGIGRSSNSKGSQLQPTNKGRDCLYIIKLCYYFDM